MKTKNNDTCDKIELRSEKVRNIIGSVPPTLVRWGIVVIALILIMLILAISLIPYPYEEDETIFQYLFFHKK